jgi:uncharacterized membrane protein
MGYSSLMIARLLLRMRQAPVRLPAIVALTLLASMIMVAWDVGMDPYQSTVSGVWIWHTGGGYFGVGLHNYIGWFGTVFCFLFVYHLFASRFAEQPNPQVAGSGLFSSIPALLYAAFALGNITPIWIPSVTLPYASPDNYKGTPEALTQSLGLISIFVMGIPVIGSLLVLWRERDLSGSADRL